MPQSVEGIHAEICAAVVHVWVLRGINVNVSKCCSYDSDVETVSEDEQQQLEPSTEDCNLDWYVKKSLSREPCQNTLKYETALHYHYSVNKHTFVLICIFAGAQLLFTVLFRFHLHLVGYSVSELHIYFQLIACAVFFNYSICRLEYSSSIFRLHL